MAVDPVAQAMSQAIKPYNAAHRARVAAEEEAERIRLSQPLSPEAAAFKARLLGNNVPALQTQAAQDSKPMARTYKDPVAHVNAMVRDTTPLGTMDGARQAGLIPPPNPMQVMTQEQRRRPIQSPAYASPYQANGFLRPEERTKLVLAGGEMPARMARRAMADSVDRARQDYMAGQPTGLGAALLAGPTGVDGFGADTERLTATSNAGKTNAEAAFLGIKNQYAPKGFETEQQRAELDIAKQQADMDAAKLAAKLASQREELDISKQQADMDAANLAAQRAEAARGQIDPRVLAYHDTKITDPRETAKTQFLGMLEGAMASGDPEVVRAATGVGAKLIAGDDMTPAMSEATDVLTTPSAAQAREEGLARATMTPYSTVDPETQQRQIAVSFPNVGPGGTVDTADMSVIDYDPETNTAILEDGRKARRDVTGEMWVLVGSDDSRVPLSKTGKTLPSTPWNRLGYDLATYVAATYPPLAIPAAIEYFGNVSGMKPTIK